MTRADRIAKTLDYLQGRGTLREWYTYAPGDRHGRRWVLIPAQGSSRTYSTREVEAYIEGCSWPS